jgi:hypothetical protein
MLYFRYFWIMFRLLWRGWFSGRAGQRRNFTGLLLSDDYFSGGWPPFR